MANDQAVLGPIVGATVLAADLDAATAPYVDYLGYQVLDMGAVSTDQAAVWNTSAHGGAAYKVLGPESGERQWIRFVEAPPVPGYKAMTTYGWHSMEIVVADVDALPAKLQGSPFIHLAGPANLGTSSAIRAMQVLGRAEEVLYLTQTPTDGSLPHLPAAKSFVDRIFIMPLGTPDMMASRDWYMQKFAGVGEGMVAPDIELGLVTNAMGLPEGTKMGICTVKLAGQTLIEIDDYPNSAKARPHNPDSLSPGIASVSFATDALDKVGLPFVAEPRALAGAPYGSKRVGVTTGLAGELIELVEE
jgi:hypothetical protein